MAAENILRALQTVRFMRPRQAAMQIRRRLSGPARHPRRPLADGIDDVRMSQPVAAPSPEGRIDEQGAVVLLGQPGYDPLAEGWQAGSDPLWSYTLHYHGWLSRLTTSDAQATVLAWIDEHRHGIGWEPYPTSIRLMHWLGWLQGNSGPRLTGPRERILASMAAQLEHLAAHLEDHIDGNHLWTNLAALTACGLGLRGSLADDVLERSASRFSAVVEEQLYRDGIHRERTPTYHCLVAEQLAIVVGLAKGVRPALAQALEPKLHAMLDAAAAFTHPDGDVALFGDSQLDAPVTPGRLANRLGARLSGGSTLAPDGGFARRQWGDWTLMWTFGGVGLPWQTGHAHGDALAVEMSLGSERVIVDAGVGTYQRGNQRSYARSTRAHNTATVGFGAPDQHELWASHRIGRRAEPQLVRADDDRLVGQVRGVDSPGVHQRTIERHERGIVVRDRVDPAVPATVRWFVPMTATVTIEGGNAEIVTAGGASFGIATNSPSLACVPADGWHGMGRRARRYCLVTSVPDGGLVTTFATGH